MKKKRLDFSLKTMITARSAAMETQPFAVEEIACIFAAPNTRL